MIPALKAVIFDWAGTMIDFGSRAPVVALCKLFESAGIAITEAEARADMGMAKRDHIAAILNQPRVSHLWAATHGAIPGAAEVDTLFSRTEPLMREAALECSQLIPGAADVAAWLRKGGVKIGSCTGYTREMMQDILPLAEAQGYKPDQLVCAGETVAGRPSPLMVWKNLVDLAVWPASGCVKVDDAEVGIEEGRAAGIWTIGVAASGNGVGLSREAFEALSADERASKVGAARDALQKAGAHLVIDTVADLPDALKRLPIGEGRFASSRQDG